MGSLIQQALSNEIENPNIAACSNQDSHCRRGIWNNWFNGGLMIKRNKNTIISEILNICLDGASKTKIVYQANLNFRTVNPYLKLLIKNELLLTKTGPRMLYETTDKGKVLLENYNRIKDDLSDI
jgi:predicted transcriptional regulator